MGNPLRDQATRAAASIAALALAGCGAVGFLSSDPGLPRDRAARFERFVSEWSLSMIDTAPPLERVRSATSADDLTGLRWDETRRRQARRNVEWSTLKRLERDFPESRLSAADAALARMIRLDLTDSLGLEDGADLRPDSPPPPDASGSPFADTLHALAATPWSGLAIETPSVLLREHPSTSARDLERWWAEVRALVERLESVAPIGTLPVAPPEESLPPRLVLERLYADLVELSGSAGAGGSLDPILGPFTEALRALPGPGGAKFTMSDRSELQRRLRLALEALTETYDAALSRADGDAGARRRRAEGTPLEGLPRARWTRALRLAAGPEAQPSTLGALGRREVERLTRALAPLLGVPAADSLEDVRQELARIRERQRSAPGGGQAPRTPDALWTTVGARLSELVAEPPAIVLRASEARTFERPHGRWSPFVPGDLRPAADPVARPSTFLKARSRDPLTPLWLREAEALRYGVPGRALLDAFVRSADRVPQQLRATRRPAIEEGWSLYALGAAADAGLLPENDSGFGRLTQELVAFAHLVVDVGIHGDGWTESQAIDYLLEVTPLARSAATEAVVRALAHPGRSAVPAIGLLRLRTLRQSVMRATGDQFDAAEFHRALLAGGAAPMSEIDRRIEAWLNDGARATRSEGRVVSETIR